MTHVVCLLNVESDRATFTWSEGPASFEPYQLEGGVFSDFKEIAEETREKLADLVKDYLYAPDNLPQASYALAEIGHELYQQIFDPGAGQLRIAKQIREWLTELRDAKAVDTMEIVMERPWALPWNLIYDKPPDRDAFLSKETSGEHWKPFWGLRYQLAAGRRVNPLRRLPLPREPRVLMVLDPQIRDGLPEEQQKRLAEFIESHHVEVATSKDELKQDARTERPDLLYWLSHATPEALVLGGEEVRARDLRRLLRWESEDGAYELGGFAFLNACQTAESGEAGSFLDTLHSVGYSGMVGTEHQTVDTFAAPFGLDFLEAFLDQQLPVGKILRDLHGRVPLGLLYGAYCPPDLKLDEPANALKKTSVQVESVFVEGLALGAVTDYLESPPLPEQPYRSLDYYGPADRALFAGRDADVERFTTLLDEDRMHLFVLHGESGVGKSSFLHAGVIPYLEQESVGYQFLRIRDSGESQPSTAADPVLFIRATNDPFGQLAQSLCSYTAAALTYPTPSGETATVDLPKIIGELLGREPTPDVMAAALREDGTLLGRLLAAISRSLPFSLIVTIDQCEEIFTLAETAEDAETARLAMNMFRRSAVVEGDFKIILSLRTEYYGRLIDRVRRGLHDTSAIRDYLLTDFDEASVVEAIERPTLADAIPHSSEVPREKYGFHFEEGLPEEIARCVVRFSSQRRDSVLPLVQVICNQLYQRVCARDDKRITHDDLQSLGGIEGGMRNHVENLIGELLHAHTADKKPLQKLFTQLYLRQPDGSLTTALLPEDEVQRRWSGRMGFADLTQQAVAKRLMRINTLRVGGGEEGRYVSLGHDSMAKLAAAWDEELSRGARMRKMAAIVAGVSVVAVVFAVVALFAALGWQEAEENLQTARETVNTYFTDVSEHTLLNAPGLQKLRHDLLSKAEDHYQRFVDDNAGHSDLHQDLARAHFNLGRIHEAASDIDDDETAGKDVTALSKYKDALAELASAEKTNEVLLQRSAILMAMSRVKRKQKKHDEALSDCTKARDLRIELVASEPTNADYRMRLADAVMQIGVVKMQQAEADLKKFKELIWDAEDLNEEGEQDKAAELEAQAESLQQTLLSSLMKVHALYSEANNIRLAHSRKANLRDLQELGDGYFNLGRLEKELAFVTDDTSHDDKAMAAFEKARDAFQAARELAPEDVESRFKLAKCFHQIGFLKSDAKAAMEHYLIALKSLQPLANFNPGIKDYQGRLKDLFRDLLYLSQDEGVQVPVRHQEDAREFAEQLLLDAPDDQIAKELLKAWPENEKLGSPE